MKVRELNALLNKLQNKDAEVVLGVPTEAGDPNWLAASFVLRGEDQVGIIPKEIEEAIANGYSRDQIVELARREIGAEQQRGRANT